MNNNDIFKKLRVALQLRDDQIVDILQLVDFRISKAELGAFFRNADHPNYMECGDQVLRNFLNGLVIHLRGTKENPKNPMEVIQSHKPTSPSTEKPKSKPIGDKKPVQKSTLRPTGKPTGKPGFKKKPEAKPEIVEKVKFNNGKKK
ncbi:DUF1456 family protein [Flavobacterium piscinae]|uniref:DUF1456 family protein n=1 Tax=Flavobacterium piscinae TaxID=2506424 RepID=A0A4Q1KQI2_9FLAO|nr:DUF1456 family protein [Flavobacterium piscinae]MBC8884501.1 DUF1456 family protein [Flavobacterium piscinae]RXR31770.1 DUF1456 family protein [Flavobacterium piscinae]